MLDRVRKTIREYDMIEPGCVVIAAVSGGPDSMCMLDALCRLRSDMGFEVEVAHFEHGIRGERSKEDARFVADVARRRELSFHMQSGSTPDTAGENGMSIEEAAREGRYAFFERLLSASGPKARIATGHTANDQAETLLMRLIRGAGIRGMGAIPPIRGGYIRPLIDVSRNDVISYLESRNIEWREDETNVSGDFLRNRIRMELIPFIEKNFNPSLVETLKRTSDASRAAIEFIDRAGDMIVSRFAVKKGEGLYLPRKAVADQHPAVVIGVFEAMLRTMKGDLRKLTFDHRIHPTNALRKGRSGIYALPDGWIAAVDSGGLLITRAPIAVELNYSMPLKAPGLTIIAATGISIEAEVIETPDGEPWKDGDGSEAYFDFDAMDEPLIVRAPAEGDRINPMGMDGSKKLHDIFTDMKIPRWSRPRYPVLTAGEEVAWLAPLKQSDKFKVGENTKKVLRLTMRR